MHRRLASVKAKRRRQYKRHSLSSVPCNSVAHFSLNLNGLGFMVDAFKQHAFEACSTSLFDFCTISKLGLNLFLIVTKACGELECLRQKNRLAGNKGTSYAVNARVQEESRAMAGSKLAFGKAFVPKGQKQSTSGNFRSRPRRQSDTEPATWRVAQQGSSLNGNSAVLFLFQY